MVQLFVRTLAGTTSCVEAQQDDTVVFLKQLIEAQEGVPAEVQGLVHQGKQLQDDLSLEHYNIGAGSTVHLVLRLRGGKGGFGALLRGQGRDGKVTTNFDAMRDLQGRRLRHQFSEQKLAEWKAQAKERELEKIAMQHMKDMAKEQKRQERDNVDTAAVVAAQEETVARAAQAVQDAVAAGVVAGSSGAGKAGASAGAAIGKRKSPEQAEKAGPAKKSKMLAMLEDLGSDVSDSEAEEDA
mmetsp:Transcript_16563/g.41350  ORF Transcript_16563/g.41350 Transcript_16563/m.41350 type:complete len:240 (-) Transcript_16563:284-1003(-)|eukprot:CAMPEP_0202867426 /NCGR_PEP_ID=MMETSP1391-20130828/9413_1 /ASSEMBLY_ACC=CAM_ASM_000867 /TAXON_ID=1034604 /ORGANISM="Chlamydomonas leiostraca, Strain SAG 11-49" /LENGTH=239 /DNA_ID=CAMNT_0049547473 /DNA_START=46 /DNA_END=765 /DNA_ORIENTATION=+